MESKLLGKERTRYETYKQKIATVSLKAWWTILRFMKRKVYNYRVKYLGRINIFLKVLPVKRATCDTRSLWVNNLLLLLLNLSRSVQFNFKTIRFAGFPGLLDFAKVRQQKKLPAIHCTVFCISYYLTYNEKPEIVWQIFFIYSALRTLTKADLKTWHRILHFH